MGYFVVGLEQQHGINTIGRKLRIVGLAEDRPDIVELLFLRALLNVLNCFRIDVNGINRARSGQSAGGTHREPSRSGTDVGNILAGLDGEHVHYAVDLQTLVPSWGIENGEITGIRRAGLALW